MKKKLMSERSKAGEHDCKAMLELSEIPPKRRRNRSRSAASSSSTTHSIKTYDDPPESRMSVTSETSATKSNDGEAAFSEFEKSSSTEAAGSKKRKTIRKSAEIKIEPVVAAQPNTGGVIDENIVTRPPVPPPEKSYTPPPGSTWAVDEKIFAYDIVSTRWYAAKITNIDPSSKELYIHFEGWGASHDIRVETSSPDVRKRILDKKEEEPLSVGDFVMAKYGGSKMQYLARIESINEKDDVFELLYDDGFRDSVDTGRNNGKPGCRRLYPKEMKTYSGKLADAKDFGKELILKPDPKSDAEKSIEEASSEKRQRRIRQSDHTRLLKTEKLVTAPETKLGRTRRSKESTGELKSFPRSVSSVSQSGEDDSKGDILDGTITNSSPIAQPDTEAKKHPLEQPIKPVDKKISQIRKMNKEKFSSPASLKRSASPLTPTENTKRAKMTSDFSSPSSSSLIDGPTQSFDDILKNFTPVDLPCASKPPKKRERGASLRFNSKDTAEEAKGEKKASSKKQKDDRQNMLVQPVEDMTETQTCVTIVPEINGSTKTSPIEVEQNKASFIMPETVTSLNTDSEPSTENPQPFSSEIVESQPLELISEKAGIKKTKKAGIKLSLKKKEKKIDQLPSNPDESFMSPKRTPRIASSGVTALVHELKSPLRTKHHEQPVSSKSTPPKTTRIGDTQNEPDSTGISPPLSLSSARERHYSGDSMTSDSSNCPKSPDLFRLKIGAEQFLCDYCENTYPSYRSLGNHRRYHRNKNESKDEARLQLIDQLHNEYVLASGETKAGKLVKKRMISDDGTTETTSANVEKSRRPSGGDATSSTPSQPIEMTKEIRDKIRDIIQEKVALKDQDLVHCLCGMREEDGTMIQCDRCGLWQHEACMIEANPALFNLHLDQYMCLACTNPKGARPGREKRLQEIQSYSTGVYPMMPLTRLPNETDSEFNQRKVQHADDHLKKQELLRKAASFYDKMLILQRNVQNLRPLQQAVKEMKESTIEPETPVDKIPAHLKINKYLESFAPNATTAFLATDAINDYLNKSLEKHKCDREKVIDAFAETRKEYVAAFGDGYTELLIEAQYNNDQERVKQLVRSNKSELRVLEQARTEISNKLAQKLPAGSGLPNSIRLPEPTMTHTYETLVEERHAIDPNLAVIQDTHECQSN